MHVPVVKSSPSLGFLTVLQDEAAGFCGGFLLLNQLGRPLEFHCTSPILPNRAQEILYGPTLKPFLFGEQIGRTLVEKAKQRPSVIFADQTPTLSLRDFLDIPMVLVREAGQTPAAEATGGNGRGASNPSTFCLGENIVSASPRHQQDRQQAEQLWTSVQEGLDLWEPFERIREALSEARGGAKQNAA